MPGKIFKYLKKQKKNFNGWFCDSVNLVGKCESGHKSKDY